MDEKIKNLIFQKLLKDYVVILALVLLVIFNGIMSPVFLKPANLLNILRQVSFVGIIAVGMTFVIISGGIDLSVGSMTGFIGGLMIMVLNGVMGGSGGSELASTLIAIVCGLLIGPILGLVNGIVITKGKIVPFIATLSGMAVYRSLAIFLADGGEFRSQSFTTYGQLGMEGLGPISYPVLIWVAVIIIGQVLLSSTRYGRYVYAIGSNEQAVRYSGINVDRIKLITYTLIGACCGVSAMLVSSRMNSVSSSGTGMNYELDAIAAVIIGGTKMKGGSGTIWGTVVGVIILGIINNMLNLLNVSVYLQGTVKGLIIIAAVFVQRKEGSD
jgi:ribose transport system permease protein